DDLPPHGLQDHLSEIGKSYLRWLAKMSEIATTLNERNHRQLRWNEQYSQALEVAEYFPDLLGHAGPEAESLLRKSFTVNDPRISLFALRSLLLLKKPLPEGPVYQVAADDEVRCMLFESFAKSGIP